MCSQPELKAKITRCLSVYLSLFICTLFFSAYRSSTTLSVGKKVKISRHSPSSTKNCFVLFPQERFDMFRHFSAGCRKLHCYKKMRNRNFSHFTEYLIGNCHFRGSLVTSNNFPYASKDRREANEIVIISDSIDAVKVITIIII